LKEKSKLAEETFKETNMEDHIELILGDARDYISTYKNIAFCFLDAEKEVYDVCYDLIIPNMVKGGILIADNTINHYETLKPMIDKALADDRIDALIVPIGKGELLCRKL
jgi:predicted O-methyltransferase YrrM